jgi:uncharacterized protein YhaN
MRFRELELIRYGGFADRLLDLGDGSPDLHVVVGPNEAGKSTTLQAVSDFLFGIGGQTSQGWRWGYQELRIRAVLEHDGQTIEAVRRKGNKDTLLDRDSSPLRSDPIAPLLRGIDRAAFERMYGLTHQRLREGGDAILLGRDDVARITLEAGTGVAGIGREMELLSGMAAELFKPGGSVPLVNRLMRERAEALREVRERSITESQWSDQRRRRQEAEDQKASLLQEAGEIEREASKLERIARARAPLARLAHNRAELEGLGPATDLPVDASERLARARAERLSATERAEAHAEDLRRQDEAASALVAPADLLGLADRVRDLEERRPVIEAAQRDLLRRRADRDSADERITAARAEARLPEGAPLPTAGWRRRGEQLLQQRREAAASAAATALRRTELERTHAELLQRRGSLTELPGLAAVEAALAAVPAEGDDRLQRLQQEATRKRTRADEALAALAPWTGDVAKLRSLDPPGASEGAAAARKTDDLRADIQAARREADTHLSDATRSQARATALAGSGALPTPEVIGDARRRRDMLLNEVVAGALARGEEALAAVAEADQLADRRDAEAERVAEHAAARAAEATAVQLEQLARTRVAGREQELGALEEEWTGRLAALGFARAVAPGDLASWLDRRSLALAAADEVRDAEESASELRRTLSESSDALKQALTGAGAEAPETLSGRISAASALVRQAADAAVRHEQLEERIAEASNAVAVATTAADSERKLSDERDRALAELVNEVGLAVELGETGLSDALVALEAISEDVVVRAGLERQIAGMERDVREFVGGLAEVLAALGRTASETPTRTVADLASQVRAAQTARDRLEQMAGDRTRLSAELEKSGLRIKSAQSELDELVARAGVSDERQLDAAVAAARRRSELVAAIGAAEEELRLLDDGSGPDALAAAVAEFPAHEEAAARRGIEERREALAAAREEVGRARAEADEAWNQAARDSAAADAQQVVAETGAALATAAEAHVEAAAAAALLRWVLDRHRQVNQAPLIARAGGLFATVTDGAYQGLRVDYDEEDRPTIVAVRQDGLIVGVEGLSEGTRDQLYLALRLGSIDTGGHPLPIVCDDLLITADDARAGAMLRVLAAASAGTQVILFTHHEHLVDVATAAIGTDRFVLHRLQRALSAVA